MDIKAAELAILAHNEFDRSLSPHYKQLRDALLAELALNGADILTLRGEKHENDVDNRTLISRFIATLPGESIQFDEGNRKRSSKLESLHIDELLLQQTNSFFYITQPNKSNSAHYIVGADPRTKQILASPMANKGAEDPTTTLSTLTVFSPISFAEHPNDFRTSHYEDAPIQSKKSQRIADNLITELYAGIISDLMVDDKLSLQQSEVVSIAHELFDKESGLYTITSGSKDSKVLSPRFPVANGFINFPSYAGYDAEDIAFISDEEMARFNVPEHLSRLAVAFDKSRELTELFTANGSDDTEEGHLSDTFASHRSNSLSAKLLRRFKPL